MLRASMRLALGALAVLAVGAGCSTYIDGFYYAPRPVTAMVGGWPASTQPTQPPPPPACDVQASVVGVRREDGKDHIPASIEVRVRIENNGANSVVCDARGMQLTTGALIKFDTPVLMPAEPVELKPGQAVVIGAFFPFPPGTSWDNLDLGHLDVHWGLRVDGRPVPLDFAFHRQYYYAYYYYSDPYWGYWGYGGPYVYGRVGVRGRW